jgi:hypothetical protein
MKNRFSWLKPALESRFADVVVIGAVALAVHGYVRHTEDIDLGVHVAIRQPEDISRVLAIEGFAVELRKPDSADQETTFDLRQRSGAGALSGRIV